MDTVLDADQVREVIESLGVKIAGDTSNDFLCYCPFHSNTFSPAFTISKNTGLYMCHNPSCSAAKGGNLIKIMVLLGGKNPMEARRLIAKRSIDSGKSLLEKIIELSDESDIKAISDDLVRQMEDNYSKSGRAKSYMESRGFDERTTQYFRVGYDPKSDMVLVPIFNPQGEPVGFNGRTIEGKRFRLSKDLPRNELLFNLHNAKRQGGTAVVCESQFDVMKMHQAGFPNGVCFLGSSISDRQVYLLQRYFNRIIIMTDADPAGRKAGHTLSQKLRGVSVEWAIWDWGVIYPHDAKDVGDMTLEEIRHCIKNAVSDISYRTYSPA